MKQFLMGIALVVFTITTATTISAVEVPPLNRFVEPTHFGRVTGSVYDGLTGQPIEKATVIFQNDGLFPDKGPTVGKTDTTGRYACNALIGRKSTKTNALGVLAVLAGGGAGASVGESTFRIDAKRLAVRVTCDNYHSYEGVLESRHSDAKSFSMAMQPILLTPIASQEVSTAAGSWGNAGIVSLSLDKQLAKPREPVTITAKVECPRLRKRGDLRLIMSAPGWKQRELRSTGEDPEMTFSATFDAPRTDKLLSVPITVRVFQSPYDLFSGGEQRSVLLQVSSKEDPSVSARADAYAARAVGENAKAQELLKPLCASSSALLDDYRLLAVVSEDLHDYSTASQSWARALELTPDKDRITIMGPHARALVSDGKPDQVLAAYASLVEKCKPDRRPSQIPLSLMVALGNANLASGNLDAAEKISRDLIKWPGADEDTDTSAFRSSLKQAQAEVAIKSDPTSSAAWAQYGRALLDQRRWEEGVAKLSKSLQMDPNQPAVRSDLDYALLHITQNVEQPEALEERIERARSATVAMDGKKQRKSTDFFTWHTLASLLYEKYRAQTAAGDPTAADTQAECMSALIEALTYGREGKDKQSSYYWTAGGGFSSQTVGMEGFAYAEADCDFAILQALRSLEKNKDNYLAEYELANALFRLGRLNLAKECLTMCLASNPDFCDGICLSAVLEWKTGDAAKAKSALEEVLRRNPRHPTVNLSLSEILMEEGDSVGAATCLANHAKYYGRRQ